MANLQNPVKAIRAKCLDCCCGNPNEVRLCTVESCALFPFRFGKNPYRKELTPEQKAAKIAALTRRTPYTVDDSAANSPSEGTYIPQDIPSETLADTQEEKA